MRDRLRRIEQSIRTYQPKRLEPWTPPEYGALAAIADMRRFEEQATYRMPSSSVCITDIDEEMITRAAVDLNHYQAMWACDRQRYMHDFKGAVAAGFLESSIDPEWLVPAAGGY